MLENGCGKTVADGVYDIVQSWHITTRIVALSYDTCSVNTGKNSGEFNQFLNLFKVDYLNVKIITVLNKSISIK